MAVSSATAQPPKPPPQPKAEAPKATADKKDATATAKPSQPSTQAPRAGIRTPDSFDQPSGGRAQPASVRDARDTFQPAAASRQPAKDVQPAKDIIGGGAPDKAEKPTLESVQAKFDAAKDFVGNRVKDAGKEMQERFGSMQEKLDTMKASFESRLSDLGKSAKNRPDQGASFDEEMSNLDTELSSFMKDYGIPLPSPTPQTGSRSKDEGGAAGGIGENRGLRGGVPAAGAAGGIAESPSSRSLSSLGSLAGLFDANFSGGSSLSSSGLNRGGGSRPSQEPTYLDGRAGGSGGSRTLTVPTTDGSTISFHSNGNGNHFGFFNFGNQSSGGGGAAGGIAEWK